MKNFLVLLISIQLLAVNCKTTVSEIQTSNVVTLPLAEAGYEIGPETSAKVCNYDVSLLSTDRVRKPGSALLLSPGEWVATIYSATIYYWLTFENRGKIANSDNYFEKVALNQALKKLDGDILFEHKTTIQTDGFIFPDICVTVTGRTATLTGPSGHTGRLKK